LAFKGLSAQMTVRRAFAQLHERSVWFAECGCPQASGVTLTKSCGCYNSSGDDFAYRLALSGVAQLPKGGFEGIAHRRDFLVSKPTRFYERANRHGPFPQVERGYGVE
jgi:hypothetical protein